MVPVEAGSTAAEEGERGLCQVLWSERDGALESSMVGPFVLTLLRAMRTSIHRSEAAGLPRAALASQHRTVTVLQVYGGAK